jgi:hypothetical protein
MSGDFAQRFKAMQEKAKADSSAAKGAASE